MTTQQASAFFEDFKMELATTRRVLERFPDGKGDWRPHQKSKTLAELATHVAVVVGLGVAILEKDFLDVSTRPPQPPIDSAAGLLELFDKRVSAFDAAMAKADLDSLGGSWELRRGSDVMRAMPKRFALRVMMMSHLIHHRAQLTVYYRLLDVPVPSVYGPSADES